MRFTNHIILILLLAVSLLSAGCGKNNLDETKDWSVQKLYSEARKQRAKKNYEEAIKYYSLIEARYPYGRYAEQALMEQAYSYYLSEQEALAISTANRFLQLYPTHPRIDYIYYLKGLADFHGRRTFFDRLMTGKGDQSDRDSTSAKRAFVSFKEVVTRFPNSRYAPDARQRMVYLFNNLAKYEIHVAKFYYIRGAYIATINRCKNVLQQYQRTSSIEDALGLQAMAYKQIGMTRLAQNSLRVLKKNFPKSRYIEKVDKLIVTGGKPKVKTMKKI